MRIASGLPPRVISSGSSSVRANVPRAVSDAVTSSDNVKARKNLSSNKFSDGALSIDAQLPVRQTYEVDQQVFVAGRLQTVVTSYSNGSMDVYQEIKNQTFSIDSKLNGNVTRKDDYYFKSVRGNFIDRLA